MTFSYLPKLFHIPAWYSHIKKMQFTGNVNAWIPEFKTRSHPKLEVSVSRWDLEGSAVNPVLVSIFNNDLTWSKIIFKVFSPVPHWKVLLASQISCQNLWESQKQL